MPYYTRSNGEKVDITTMLPPHLISATKKLSENCPPEREDELAAMQAQVAANKVTYRAELVAAIATETDPEALAKLGEKLAKLDAEA